MAHGPAAHVVVIVVEEPQPVAATLDVPLLQPPVQLNVHRM